jgi:glycosyltransferase involved in cell wall biosynthesis
LVRYVLNELQNHHEFEFIVICNNDPGFGDLRHYTYVPWNSRTEVDDLLKLNIGIMPQFDGPFDRGKAGLKAMQYSALGVVPVVSPTGGGEEVVRHQETGVVVRNNSEGWYTALDALLKQPESWPRLGESARQFVLERFSMTANVQKYLSLFEE